MSNWISVKDRLPGREMDGIPLNVAVRLTGGRIVSETDVFDIPAMTTTGQFKFWNKKVTHWQPLPAPPAEGE